MNKLSMLNGWANSGEYNALRSAQSYLNPTHAKVTNFGGGSACGSGDGDAKPKPSACGAGDDDKKPQPSACGAGERVKQLLNPVHVVLPAERRVNNF
jgi:hypothetical protein